MGVNLRDLVLPRDIEMADLHGKTIAVDALNTIYQFLSIIRDRFTGEPLKDSKGNVTSHLSGLFYRGARMLQNGLTPVFVFDGKPPEFKQRTRDERRKIREEARKKWKKAVDEGDAEKVRLYSQQSVRVTDGMLDEARRLLDAMGIQCVTAPSEGEAQAAWMNRKGIVHSCGSQDWDSLLFGAPLLVRNLTITGKRKLPRKETYVMVRPQMIELEDALRRLGISQEQLILIGMLTGTDYNPGGVQGFGPKRALGLVREHKTLDAVLRQVPWTFDTPAERIFDFFKNPPAKDVEIEEKPADPERIRGILAEHDFTPERTENTLRKLSEAQDAKKQSSLSKFF